MEVLKILDKYIEKLNVASSLETDDLEALFEEVIRVVFSPDEIKGLALDYCYTNPPDLQSDARKLKAKLEYERAALVDANEKAMRQAEAEHEQRELEKIRLQVESAKGNISIHNTNRNENTNTFSVSFASARESISAMSSLPEEEIQEALEKIDALEAIVTSLDTKSKKWSKAKEIIQWIADKGVDVGIAILPLLLQIK